jgi:hypothetical protein
MNLMNQLTTKYKTKSITNKYFSININLDSI